jgi:hypothetical protein
MAPRALVRRPGDALPGGIVTHTERRPVDVGLAREQWAAYASLGYEPVVVDIGEFQKLEGCVTCLSVLIR